jgi:glycosyltransferase involved in cell wall biosynthesis
LKNHISVSAVIASFNQVNFIEEAVLSLASQVDEIVVIDDKSTDGTYEKLENLKKKLPNLVLIKKEQRLGVSQAYNHAVEISSGDILVIQGGDDVSMPDRVRLQVEALQIPSTSLTYSLPVVINSHSAVMSDEIGAEFFRKREYQSDLSELFFHGNFLCAPSVSMRRGEYLKYGGFPVNVDALQDYFLWLKCAENGNMLRLGERIVKYRKHGKNLSRHDPTLVKSIRRELVERIFVINKFLESISESGLNELLLQSGIDGASLPPQIRSTLLKSRHPHAGVRLQAIQELLEIFSKQESYDIEHLAVSGLIDKILLTTEFYLD